MSMMSNVTLVRSKVTSDLMSKLCSDSTLSGLGNTRWVLLQERMLGLRQVNLQYGRGSCDSRRGRLLWLTSHLFAGVGAFGGRKLEGTHTQSVLRPRAGSVWRGQMSSYLWQCWSLWKSRLSPMPGWLCWPHWPCDGNEDGEHLGTWRLDTVHQPYGTEEFQLKIKQQ